VSDVRLYPCLACRCRCPVPCRRRGMLRFLLTIIAILLVEFSAISASADLLCYSSLTGNDVTGLVKLEFRGTSFPRSILVTSSRGALRGCRACRRRCHEDATRKLLSWNLGFTARRYASAIFAVFVCLSVCPASVCLFVCPSGCLSGAFGPFVPRLPIPLPPVAAGCAIQP